ncbi:MAG: Uma2 family endonuclease, partial [Chloroflexota bacterium]
IRHASSGDFQSQMIPPTFSGWCVQLLLREQEVGTVRLSPCDLYITDDTVLQPDVMLIKPDNPNCELEDDGYWHGAPDLVVEVLSPGTASLDRGRKFQLYAQHGVLEYWLADPQAQFIEVFTPQNSQFIQQGLYEINATFTSGVLGADVIVQKCFA